MESAPPIEMAQATLHLERKLERVDGFWSSAWRQFRRNKLAVISLGFILFIALTALVVPFLLPQTYAAQDLSVSLQGPSWRHPFGTDALGRDLMTRMIFGARISLTVGIVVQMVILAIGVPMGLMAGYLGGKTDTFIMRLVDVLYAIPNLLFHYPDHDIHARAIR
jgi:ABC-type dipeptide/oligopeptide/nickel transport system permease subunit